MPLLQPTLGFVLHDVARLLRKRFEQRARDLGLTRSQWQCLAFLAPNEGIHQGGLAEILEVEPITLGRILDKLEARGLIERRSHPTDRRIRLLYLTPDALPLLDQMRELGDVTRAEALEGLSDPDRERLMGMLTHIKRNLVSACGKPVRMKEARHG
ncbi:MarR family winged helix-turn-helix transcriptional regulator [Chelatococcus reniformis]|uniref:MarR family transcriptional regulator n=1 Tax=Chelatococcus reniformis TaxID=1494448 RepID=A0A916X6Q2_9HYPH|nr:MarR family transcriptional regulator [Chelatococcus reniformis]GGC45689.1 MarR family transcriptional regulator [Chelatococcus reniformis]